MKDTLMAFPQGSAEGPSGGLTIRDYFAGQALAGLMANATLTDHASGPTDMANAAYTIADAMLLARKMDGE